MGQATKTKFGRLKGSEIVADSWLIDGNCDNCRRKNYCSKPCKKANSRRKNALYNDVMSSTGMGQLLDKAGARERFENNMKCMGYID